MCMNSCSGLMITSYARSKFEEDLDQYISKPFNNYNMYKKWLKFSSGLRGKGFNFRIIAKIVPLECEWKNKLRYVRIYFDTPTFDRITKDRAAKFVDMLSAIGGTMGLLTGFSIISAVAIVYFTIKIVINVFKRKKIQV